jgi:hypothetical protein
MNTIEKAGINKGKPGQTPKAPLAPARASRVLSVVRGNEERSLHLSPILQKIKDDGPALIDGEVLKEAAATLKLTKPAAATDAKATVAAPVFVAQPLLADKHVKVLLGFCAALTLGLCCSLYVAWQQQQRLANVEYLLETLVITTTR